MTSKVVAIALIAVGVAMTAVGLFGQFVLTEDEGHHDGREPTFALQSAQGTDELIVDVGEPNSVAVSIERAGQPIQSFDEVHGEQLHVFAVSDGLTEYQHEHPEQVGGVFEPVLVGGGDYRVITQSAPSGGPDLLELGADVTTTGEPALTGQFITATELYELPGGLTVERQGFDFVLSEPWQGEEHHGGPALLIMVRDGDGAFVHEHAEVPEDDRFRFNLDLPGSGEYLAALEFLHDGEVQTALFRVRV